VKAIRVDDLLAGLPDDGRLVIVEGTAPPSTHCDLIFASDPSLLPALTVPDACAGNVH
jgi:hypothetical protein